MEWGEGVGCFSHQIRLHDRPLCEPGPVAPEVGLGVGHVVREAAGEHDDGCDYAEDVEEADAVVIFVVGAALRFALGCGLCAAFGLRGCGRLSLAEFRHDLVVAVVGEKRWWFAKDGPFSWLPAVGEEIRGTIYRILMRHNMITTHE